MSQSSEFPGGDNGRRRATIGTTPVRQPLERIDQRDNAFWRRKHGLDRGAEPAAIPRPAEERAADGEAGDPLQRIFFGEERRANCLNEQLAGMVDGPCRPEQHGFGSPEMASRHLTEAALFLGADLAGCCELDEGFVYTHAGHESGAASERAGEPVELDHGYAIVLAAEMDYRLISSSPSYIDAAEVGAAYVRVGLAAVSLAAYLRELGWPARAHIVRNEQVLQVPLAVQAGLGELGRNGFLVTARYGPRVRLATVTTKLPLAPAKPVNLGVEAFCRRCLKCADCCPSRSIPAGKPEWLRGAQKWRIEGDDCLAFWGSAPERWGNCNVCIKVCPWNKPDTWWHAWVAAAVRRLPGLTKPLVLLDDLIYGRNPRPRVTFLGYDNRKPSPWVGPKQS